MEHHLTIAITDNGRGIDPKLIRKDSHGLLNIRQRAQLIGAQVEWKKPVKFSSGTELSLKINMDEVPVRKGGCNMILIADDEERSQLAKELAQ